MSKFIATPMSVVSEEYINAPLIGVCNYTISRLLRLGVINDNDEIAEETVKSLATTFASNFYDALIENNEEDIEAVAGIYVSLYGLWEDQEIVGLYYYITLCCGLMDCSAPRELLWIARYNKLLAVYLEGFIGACQEYTNFVEEEGGQKNSKDNIEVVHLDNDKEE